MRRRILPFLVLVAIGLAGLPAAALAGGWVVVSLDMLPDAAVAGEDTAIGFRVLQHGQHPAAGLRPEVTLTHRQSGSRTTAAALPEGAEGHYQVRVVLPQPGTWDWTITAIGPDHPMPALTVLPASTGTGATAPSVTTPTPAALPTVGWRGQVLSAGGALLALGLLLTWKGLRSSSAQPVYQH